MSVHKNKLQSTILSTGKLKHNDDKKELLWFKQTKKKCFSSEKAKLEIEILSENQNLCSTLTKNSNCYA